MMEEASLQEKDAGVKTMEYTMQYSWDLEAFERIHII